ncbi:MAG: ABC transporter permease, partial [Bacteroidetes bacterium]|nr:ABC transporter permease [Bacteroidota bacterium]
MIKNYFKIALRNLRKNTLYSGINIFGLSVGLAACLLIGIYISHELSYDKFNKNADRVVRLTMEYSFEGTVNKTATTGTEPGPEFKRVFPYIDTYARTYITHNIFSNGDKMFDEPGVLFADNDFFKIFSFKILYGDPATALDAPDKIVLTKSMAKKYFGTDDAVGKTLHAKKKEYRVSAVCEDVPANSQIKFDFATQFLNLGDNVKKETWWTANWITYFLLNNKTDINKFQKDVDVYMKSAEVRTSAGLTGKNYLSYHAEPLLSVHLHSALNGFEPNSNIRYIYMFAIIALLILVIACANYSNLATAQSAGRSGEIGVRKVMGASRKQVFMQFIGESAVLTFISAILALLIAVLLVPYFNKITGKEFTSTNIIRPLPLLLLIGFSILVSLAAGLYPALVLSGTRIMNVLKKGFSFTSGNNFMRKALVITQFGISVFLIIYTVIILKQMHFMMTKDLGYNKDHIVVLPVTSSMLADFQNTK